MGKLRKYGDVFLTVFALVLGFYTIGTEIVTDAEFQNAVNEVGQFKQALSAEIGFNVTIIAIGVVMATAVFLFMYQAKRRSSRYRGRTYCDACFFSDSIDHIMKAELNDLCELHREFKKKPQVLYAAKYQGHNDLNKTRVVHLEKKLESSERFRKDVEKFQVVEQL